MTVINFSYPFTPPQLAKLCELLGVATIQVIEMQRQFDMLQPFAPQITAMIDDVGLSARDWQATALVVNPPGYSVIAGLILAEIHGRCGHFPALVRLLQVPGESTNYAVAEIINLERMRIHAREQAALARECD